MNTAIFPSIPIETVKAALSVFGSSNFYISTGDQVDRLFTGLILEDQAEKFQMPTRTLAMLYLITTFQYIETLPDIAAADALRERVDWKYALHLPINIPGMKSAVFCDFRKLLLVDQTSQEIFQLLLNRMSDFVTITGTFEKGLLSKKVIISVCQFSRLEKIWEAFNQAMQAVAITRPKWLLHASLPHWYERYSNRHRTINLGKEVLEESCLAQGLGADGMHLLEAISSDDDQELAALQEVQLLRELWQVQFECREGKAVWRKNDCAGCLLSPDIS